VISIKNDSLDPRFNLALEEYVIKEMDPTKDYLILWQNAPSVIIGRYQNTLEEVNREYVEKHGINVVRRLSGGGAVYHDLGNLNYTFVTTSNDEIRNNFRRFTEPVIKALARIGVKAEHTGRNDITIDGKKFSGTAQYYYQDRVLHHGTILFDSDLQRVQEVLTVRADKIASKGIKSVRSRVTNVIDYMEERISVKEFQQLLEKLLLEDRAEESYVYELSEQELARVNELRDARYATWEWNWGKSPKYNLKKGERFAGGYVEVLLDVDKGQIVNCKIHGDFFGKREVEELERLLVGVRHDPETLKDTLASVQFEEYMAGITREEFISCLF
jgi:lipoate-protein ligase A